MTTGTIGIKGRFLVAVLAIAQGLHQLAGNGAATRSFHTNCRCHPVGDRRVISRGTRVGNLRQLLTEFRAGRTVVLIHITQEFFVILNVNNSGDVTVVLRGGTDHRGATNVDVLDAGVIIRTGGNGGFKWVEIHNQQVDRPDTMLVHRSHMRRVRAQSQQTTVHFGMQRLHAAIHHFRKTGVFAHVDDGNAGLAQRLG